MKNGCDTVLARCEEDKLLPPNAFTLDRVQGLQEGIRVSIDQGTYGVRNCRPFVRIGGMRFYRDELNGFVFHRLSQITFVRRLASHRFHKLNAVTPTLTLRNPEDELPLYSIIKVAMVVKKPRRDRNGHPYTVFFGVRGGEIIGSSKDERLLRIHDGEEVYVFFSDGEVRCLFQEGAKLFERFLKHEEMIELRIHAATKALLAVASSSNEKEIRAVCLEVLRGMVDLVSMTEHHKGIGKMLRRKLLQDFFLRLPNEALDLVHRKLKGVLHRIDGEAARMLPYSETSEFP